MVYDVKSICGKRLGEFKDLDPSDVDKAVLELIWMQMSFTDGCNKMKNLKNWWVQV